MPIGETTQERSRTTGQQGSYGERDTGVQIQNVATFQKPGLLAVYEGRPCRIIATGDAANHSPAVLIVNEDGKLSWEEQRQVLVVDSDVLPPSKETLKTVMREFNR